MLNLTGDAPNDKVTDKGKFVDRLARLLSEYDAACKPAAVSEPAADAEQPQIREEASVGQVTESIESHMPEVRGANVEVFPAEQAAAPPSEHCEKAGTALSDVQSGLSYDTVFVPASVTGSTNIFLKIP